MSKTLNQLSDLELIALAKAVELRDVNCEVALPPKATAQVDFTVNIKGGITRGANSTRAATNRARTAQAMCMLLVVSGTTRKHGAAKLIEAWADFGSLDKNAMENRIASLDPRDKALFDECMALFQSEIVENLDRIPAKGGVKFNGTVEPV